MKLKKQRIFWLLAGCLLLVSGCKEPSPMQQQESMPAVEEIHSSVEDFDRLNKENAYIDLFNVLGGEVYTALADYQQACGWEPRLRTGQTEPVAIMELDIAAVTARALQYAVAEPAMAEIDALVLEMEPYIEQLSQVWQEMAAYYRNQMYLQDDYVQGQLYHTEILNAYNELYPLLTAFETEIIRLDAQRRAETIAYCRQQDLLIEYHLLQIVETAGELAVYLQQAEDNRGEEMPGEADAQQVQAYCSALLSHIEGFEAAANDQAQTEREQYLAMAPSFAELLDAVDAIDRCAQALYQEAQSGEMGLEQAGAELEMWLYQVTELYNNMLN